MGLWGTLVLITLLMTGSIQQISRLERVTVYDESDCERIFFHFLCKKASPPTRCMSDQACLSWIVEAILEHPHKVVRVVATASLCNPWFCNSLFPTGTQSDTKVSTTFSWTHDLESWQRWYPHDVWTDPNLDTRHAFLYSLCKEKPGGEWFDWWVVCTGTCFSFATIPSKWLSPLNCWSPSAVLQHSNNHVCKFILWATHHSYLTFDPPLSFRVIMPVADLPKRLLNGPDFLKPQPRQ